MDMDEVAQQWAQLLRTAQRPPRLASFNDICKPIRPLKRTAAGPEEEWVVRSPGGAARAAGDVFAAPERWRRNTKWHYPRRSKQISKGF